MPVKMRKCPRPFAARRMNAATIPALLAGLSDEALADLAAGAAAVPAPSDEPDGWHVLAATLRGAVAREQTARALSRWAAWRTTPMP